MSAKGLKRVKGALILTGWVILGASTHFLGYWVLPSMFSYAFVLALTLEIGDMAREAERVEKLRARVRARRNDAPRVLP